MNLNINLPILILTSKFILFFSILFILFLYIRVKFFKLKINFLNFEPSNSRKNLIELNGIIHFHTVYSDGSGKIEYIIKIAKRLKADFLISSDHNTLKPKYDGLEGYYGKLLYFAAEEINTEFGHLLAIGINNEIKRGSYTGVLSEIKKQNGVSIICHPHNWWTPWKNFNVKGYDGIEIINLDSQWRGMNPLYILLVLLTYRINPFYAMHFLSHKPKKTIKFWDSVQKHKGLKTGIAAADAHSNVKITKNFNIRMPKYEELFTVARTHVLLDKKLSGTPEKDKKLIAGAIKSGKCYFSYDMFGAPSGFYFEIFYDDKFYISGDTLNIDKKDKNAIIYSGIKINPKRNAFIINLFHNGKRIYSSKNKDLIYEIKSAEIENQRNPFKSQDNISRSSFFRVEIDVYFGYKKITYLYSNNIEIYRTA